MIPESFVAFTATLKNKTLELFETRKPEPDSLHIPFHVSFMQEAIEQKFILDVLLNYTPYRWVFELPYEGK